MEIYNILKENWRKKGKTYEKKLRDI